MTAGGFRWVVQNDGPIEVNRWMVVGISDDGNHRIVKTHDGTKATAEAWAAELRSQPAKIGRPVTQPCGTVAAYKRHGRRGETPCEPCRLAWNERQRDLYARRKASR